MRLKKGDDLALSIADYCLKKKINTAIILSGVGCLDNLHIRLAGAQTTLNKEEDLEIVSLNGTVSKGNIHIHIAASDVLGHTFGGHLLAGSIVNTTVELVMGELETYQSERCFDAHTGYDEIVFTKKEQ